MTDVELAIMVFRSLQIAVIVPFVFWVIPLFAKEGWYQYIEWRGVAKHDRRRRDNYDASFFTDLVEINRGRPKKAPKHRLPS